MENNVRTAERIAHRIARQTKNVIAWTGAAQAFLSALDLFWTLWTAWREGRVDERRSERQNRDDERRDAAIEQLKNDVKTLRYVHSGAIPSYSEIILPFAEQGTGAKLLEYPLTPFLWLSCFCSGRQFADIGIVVRILTQKFARASRWPIFTSLLSARWRLKGLSSRTQG